MASILNRKIFKNWLSYTIVEPFLALISVQTLLDRKFTAKLIYCFWH